MPNLDRTKQSNETDRYITMLETKIGELADRITALETTINAGLTSSSYFVCNNDATYDATNSKVLTIENGIITGIS